MKNALLFIFLSICGLTHAKTFDFTIKWTFQNVKQEYDHDNQVEVFIDGKNVGTSSVFKLTDDASFTLKVTSGSHKIKIVDYTFFEGKWEEHSIANNYSVDAWTEFGHSFQSSVILNLVWDETDSTSLVSNWTETESVSLVEEEKSVKLKVVWKFENVVEGFDQDIRLQVFAKELLFGTSPVAKASKGGRFTVQVPEGDYHINVVSEAYIHGQWEDYTRANDYAIDAFAELTDTFSGKTKLLLTFDVETGKTTAIWKK